VTFRKYLVLAGVTLFAAIGDTLLARGMKQVGNMTALSWADLTYVLPATSLGYVLLALIAKFFLHEQVSATRWLGIGLISAGVGFVTQGPALTRHPSHHDQPDLEAEPVGTRAEP
jgi:drug/metabolite transporter (DMT)-like permease